MSVMAATEEGGALMSQDVTSVLLLELSCPRAEAEVLASFAQTVFDRLQKQQRQSKMLDAIQQ